VEVAELNNNFRLFDVKRLINNATVRLTENCRCIETDRIGVMQHIVINLRGANYASETRDEQGSKHDDNDNPFAFSLL
jgi:hypothetical protein